MHITLVRHAESIFNCDNSRLDKDIGLSNFGYLQASILDGEYDRIFISPMKRCIDTLKYSRIDILNSIIKIDDRIREFKTDTCDFLSDETIQFESEDNFIKRFYNFRNYLLNNHDENVLILTHGDFIQYFLLIMDKKIDNIEDNLSEYPTNCCKIAINLDKKPIGSL